MLQRVKEVQESDLRMDGALARNIQRVIAVTQADIDAAAAQGKAWVVKPVVKVSDPVGQSAWRNSTRYQTKLYFARSKCYACNVYRRSSRGGWAWNQPFVFA